MESLTVLKTPEQTCQCIHTKQKVRQSTKQYGCPKCVERRAGSCNHCFICGEAGHRAVGCLKRRQATNTSQPSSEPHSPNRSRQQYPTKLDVLTDESAHVKTSCVTPLVTNKEAETNERVARLVGKKCKIKCYIHSYAVDCLLESGAQVSLLDRQWEKTYLPDHRLRPLAELIGQNALSVLAVNGQPLAYDGWLGVMVSFPNNSDPNLTIQVPFLVSSVPMDCPLIGFNVVEQLILGPKEIYQLL